MVVDDEPPSVQSLVDLLGETGRVEVVGTAANPEQALAFPRWAEVDVAFLDIVMPGMTGIELARRLPDDPLVVFVTGYNDYAVEAFRVNAVDCLTYTTTRSHDPQYRPEFPEISGQNCRNPPPSTGFPLESWRGARDRPPPAPGSPPSPRGRPCWHTLAVNGTGSTWLGGVGTGDAAQRRRQRAG
jgi:two-component system LytT family response regulator